MAGGHGHEADRRASQAAFVHVSVASKEKKFKKMVAVWTGPTTAGRDRRTPSPAGGQLRILGKMTAPSWWLISGAKPSTFQTKVCTWRTWLRTAA